MDAGLFSFSRLIVQFQINVMDVGNIRELILNNVHFRRTLDESRVFDHGTIIRVGLLGR